MTIEPIAHFRSPFSTKFGIPRQSGLVDTLRGTIQFDTERFESDMLRGLDSFTHLWIIWEFSANRGKSHSTVRPPRLGGNERLGVFATRSPFRPNPLGLSCVKIEKIHDNEIEVSGADLMDQTPIYDIKPYLPYADSHPEATGGFTDASQWKELEVTWEAGVNNPFGAADTLALQKTLALDPRPHYHHSSDRVYGMSFMGKDVQFRVNDDQLVIIGIK